MKACVLHAIRDLRYDDVPEPEIREPKELIVRMIRAGICGSDVHYYAEGGNGVAARVREPLVLGHEGVGVVERIGRDVSRVREGDVVALRPARPCFVCDLCRRHLYFYCESMRHLGSAALVPHAPGLFAEKVLVHEEQAWKVERIPPETAAFVEPLAVAYRGVRALGAVFGKRVLVMGVGPIGVLSALAAQTLGATVVAVGRRQPPLDMCRSMGLRRVVNSREEPEQLARWKEGRGWFDMMIEASGSADAALEGMAMVAPEGVVAQVGVFAPHRQPDDFGLFLSKGLRWHGVFRFYEEFGPALAALENGLINPLPLISASCPASDCVAAMQAAMSRETMKVQLVFGD